MKRNLWLFGFCLLLASMLPALADGFIIVDGPLPWPRPVPPPGPYPLPRPMPPPYRPYLFAPLEVTYHHVTARIKDQVAVTTVDQEFYNPNDRVLEGTYLFPIPTGGQINKFTMEIGGKEVEAELMSADKARRIYEDIVRKMKDPALLEYAGRDVFKVRIFPIEAHSRKRVKLSYTQVLKADGGLVNYTYPLNTEKFSAKPIQTVSVKLELESRQPLKTIYSPSHTVEIRRHGDISATIGFEAKGVKPDTDFQVLFSTERGDVGANVMAYKTGDEEGYFLLLATPGFELKSDKIMLKDVSLVLDTSGSMAGPKMAQAKKALQFCVENLNEGDRFEIIRFSTETELVFNQLVEATPEHRRKAQEFIKDLRATGGTAIDEALAKAMEIRPAASNRPYLVIFLTDGRPTIGNTDEDQILAHVAAKQIQGESGRTRIFCFGIGNDVNTHLLDKIAETTKAVSQYVLPEEFNDMKPTKIYTKIKEPVLTNLKLHFPEGIRAAKLYPSSLPDLFKGEQLIIAGRYSGEGEGKIMLEGLANNSTKHFTFGAYFPGQSRDHEFIPRLWATRRIGYLLDEIRLHGENKELKDEVTELARRYGVVTPYTAYLILEDEGRRNVPLETRSFDRSYQAPQVRQRGGEAWMMLREQKVGSEATAVARSSQALRQATTAQDAIDLGNFELNQSQSLALSGLPQGAPGFGGGGYGGGASAARPAAVAGNRIAPITGTATPALPQTQFVAGRSFYLNGNQWIDANVQKMPQAKRVRVQFNSEDYFNLLAKEPQALRWLALGQNVQFSLGNIVYEIYE